MHREQLIWETSKTKSNRRVRHSSMGKHYSQTREVLIPEIKMMIWEATGVSRVNSIMAAKRNSWMCLETCRPIVTWTDLDKNITRLRRMQQNLMPASRISRLEANSRKDHLPVCRKWRELDSLSQCQDLMNKKLKMNWKRNLKISLHAMSVRLPSVQMKKS